MTTLDVFFLGAGQPSGLKPAALKRISSNQKALDWQLQSIGRIPANKIHFIGGFHIDEIIAEYPQLNYTLVPEWKTNNVIHTLLQAPFLPKNDALLLYSDTLFRPKSIEALTQIAADVAIGVDSHWLTRYANRSDQDIDSSEVINLSEVGLEGDQETVEFTGIIKLSANAVALLKDLDSQVTTNLIELIHMFHRQGLAIKLFDLKGDWTEFNSDLDIAHFILGTKSETLYRLYPLVKHSIIGQQVTFTVDEWAKQPAFYLQKIKQRFTGKPLVIRSSSFAEDCWGESHAGGFESILNVDSSSDQLVIQAVEQVIASYQGSKSLAEDQVLIQECLNQVQMSGVVFTRSLETGAPYYRINFDDQTQSTESVTSGNGEQLRTVIVSKNHVNDISHLPESLKPVLEGVKEIEALLNYDKLDIEFAVDSEGQLHIFQVRPIAVAHHKFDVGDAVIKAELDRCLSEFKQAQISGPGLCGKHTYFGVMPDWNPAEIIGIRPKPLAFSLYRYLIVDEIWALQRHEFGYRDVSQYPLIRLFAGQPYVNIRNCLNSFIPASVPEDSAERIVNAYLNILKDHPRFHDKIEFEVALTVLSPCFGQHAERRLIPLGVSKTDIEYLRLGLYELTQQAFSRLTEDIAGIENLANGREQIKRSDISPLNKALMLLKDCKKHGTLAFSHAARAGFVAMSFINEMVTLGVISQADKEAFLSSFSTVAGEFEMDAYRASVQQITKQEFVDNYGHLRPGTYDITAKSLLGGPPKVSLFKIKSCPTKVGNYIQNF